jgi:hypothetical protein
VVRGARLLGARSHSCQPAGCPGAGRIRRAAARERPDHSARPDAERNLRRLPNVSWGNLRDAPRVLRRSSGRDQLLLRHRGRNPGSGLTHRRWFARWRLRSVASPADRAATTEVRKRTDVRTGCAKSRKFKLDGVVPNKRNAGGWHVVGPPLTGSASGPQTYFRSGSLRETLRIYRVSPSEAASRELIADPAPQVSNTRR